MYGISQLESSREISLFPFIPHQIFQWLSWIGRVARSWCYLHVSVEFSWNYAKFQICLDLSISGDGFQTFLITDWNPEWISNFPDHRLKPRMYFKRWISNFPNHRLYYCSNTMSCAMRCLFEKRFPSQTLNFVLLVCFWNEEEHFIHLTILRFGIWGVNINFYRRSLCMDFSINFPEHIQTIIITHRRSHDGF